jgi:glutathione synthase/RimK-type ligase-like ATP-grasp enzyme
VAKKILFIGRIDDRVTYDTSQSMAARMQEYTTSGISYDACNIEHLVFAYDGQELSVYDNQTGNHLDDYDGIFMLGWFKFRPHEDVIMAVARYAEAQGIPLLNTEALHLRSRSKLSQYVIAALHDVPMTPFVVTPDSKHLPEALAKANIGFPLIVKAVDASRGNSNFLVHTNDELTAAYQSAPDHIFVAQGFVPNEGDYRLLVMGDRVRMAIHRRAQDASHINNTSKGGAAVAVPLAELNQDMLHDAVRIAQLLRREVTGVDMIVHKDTGKYYLLEANNMPQLSTGSLVPDKMQALDGFLAEWLRGEA